MNLLPPVIAGVSVVSLFVFDSAQAFVVVPGRSITCSRTRNRRLTSSRIIIDGLSSEPQDLWVRTATTAKRGVVVVAHNDDDTDNANNISAALGAALGLSVRDVLLQQQHQQTDLENNKRMPSPQPVTLMVTTRSPSSDNKTNDASDAVSQDLRESLKDICEKPPIIINNSNEYPTAIEDYERVLLQNAANEDEDHDNNNKPILHAILKTNNDAAAAIQPLMSPQIRNAISFLGLEASSSSSSSVDLMLEGDPGAGRTTIDVAPERARQMGSFLQQILDFHSPPAASSSSSSTEVAAVVASISMDWPLHLSMLQANCLPKSSTAHWDSFLLLPSSSNDDDDVVLVNYLFNRENPFGGMDPLSCPTTEVTISSSRDNKTARSTAAAAAAAYTACRGNGMNSVNAACVASSVGTTMIGIDDENANETFFTWPRIHKMAQLCEQYRDHIRQGPVVRKRYIEYGYK